MTCMNTFSHLFSSSFKHCYQSIKLLSGNSKALMEEEKFRKIGKRKYEQITERMIALAAILEQLAAVNDGSSSPVPGGPATGFVPVDFSCLSSQGQALLRGKGHWQERVELMHLHTTTHGTRRWSGGGDKEADSETSPKGSSDNTFSTAAPANSSHSRSRIQIPTSSSISNSVAASAATVSANPFAAAANPTTSTGPPLVTPLGPALHPKVHDSAVLSHMNLGLGALAQKGGATKAAGTATVSSTQSLSPRNKASAQSMKESLVNMTNSLAHLSGSQRIIPNSANSSLKGEKSVTFQKIGDENLRNSK